MLIPSLVLALSGAVIVVGALVELAQAVRVRRAGVQAGSVAVRNQLIAELDPARPLMWVGLSALAALAPALVVELHHPVSDVALVVLVLGFAAERAAFLARRFGSAQSQPAWQAAIAVLTIVGGVVVALSA